MIRSTKLLIGCASTGAKFTPLNHRSTGDLYFDNICWGADIPITRDDIESELSIIYALGCRYYHYHARNPVTSEQTTENVVYQEISQLIQSRFPDTMISFGGSRNGKEVMDIIDKSGEWERVSQCALPLHLGGAHFVTVQAAIELQIICDIERKTKFLCQEDIESIEFLRTIRTYSPSDTEEKVTLEVNSTSKGANYGSSSPKVQFDIYCETINWRNKLSLLHEVEWTQFNRSYAMTRFAIEHPQLGLGSSGQINITLLFGFSPRLPFPTTYDEFKKVVNAAKRLEYDVSGKEWKRRISITVGSAVMPNQAHENFTELDIGPFRGEKMCALRRLAAYAAQADSNVDVLRTGMEDTPYEVTVDGCIVRTNNVRLVQIVSSELKRHGVEIETDPGQVRDRLGLTIVNKAYLELLKSRVSKSKTFAESVQSVDLNYAIQPAGILL